MTRNTAFALATLIIFGASAVALSGCSASNSPADKARAAVEEYATAFADLDDAKIKSLECEGRTVSPNFQKIEITGHEVGKVKETSSGMFEVALSVSADELLDWNPTVTVDVSGEPCIYSVEG